MQSKYPKYYRVHANIAHMPGKLAAFMPHNRSHNSRCAIKQKNKIYKNMYTCMCVCV